MPRLLFLLLLPPLLNACQLFDPKEDKPGFIVIEDRFLETNFSKEGTNSHKITEVWVYAEGSMLGAYEPPARVPVLRNGATRMSFYPGIKNNGISATRTPYPFYVEQRQTMDIQPGKTDTVNPVFYYQSNLKFWREEFELSFGHKFESIPGSEANLEKVSGPEVFEGVGSGKIELGADQNYFAFRSNDENLIIDAGKRGWIEMNYNTNNSLNVGLRIYENGLINKESALILNPSTDENGAPRWNKIYIDLAPITGNHLTANRFEIYFESFKDNNVEVAKFYFDNIKVVQFDS